MAADQRTLFEDSDESGDSKELARDLLGYLNFSDGTPGARFRSCLNQLWLDGTVSSGPQELRDTLLTMLQGLRRAGDAAFVSAESAEQAVRITLDGIFPAYREWHSDLLGHLNDAELFSPFLVAKMFEAVLAERATAGDGTDSSQLTAGVLLRLNQFVGYRPVAVLENGRQSEVYAHERFCALPVYLAGVGVASGPWHELISLTIGFLERLPEELLLGSSFEFERMQELVVDSRAHDHVHPVYKRTNYIFGEWDPDEISSKGYYSRFVIRRLILDALLDWVRKGGSRGREERLHDASAVLSGTILMASAISGSGPDTHASGVTLTTLLPQVARQRDHFYSRILEQTAGDRRRRLQRQASRTRQPFGHVRHELNMFLARFGAEQVQHRHLSWMYARMGYDDASREEASTIPCLAARIESEIFARLVICRREIREGNPEHAADLIDEVMGLLNRGIETGGLVDPWNILGFQGMFPLFTSREDAIPDARAELLIEIVGQVFDICSLTMSEAAVQGKLQLQKRVCQAYSRLAERWDAYATTTVNDLTPVEGVKSVEAAGLVARMLSLWREAGESAGDISFWREHVTDLHAVNSFSQVVSALLDRNDLVAAMGLLMQWLSQAEVVPLESGSHSIHRQLHRLMAGLCEQSDVQTAWTGLRRLFAFAEANAGSYWEVPPLTESSAESGDANGRRGENDVDLEHLFDDQQDGQDSLYEAAWDDVTYRDSTDDGNASDTLDEGTTPGNTEFEILYRRIEPRLKFLHTLGSLWGIAALWVSRQQSLDTSDDGCGAVLKEWLASIRGRLQGLAELVREVRDHQIDVTASGVEGNIEYDVQLQFRFLLMQNALSTTVEFLMAERLIAAVIAEPPSTVKPAETLDSHISSMLTSLFARDSAVARRCFPDFCKELRKRPLLYIPFENGGQPVSILQARTIQAVLRVLLSQFPRQGMLLETHQLLQLTLVVERTMRPAGQAVTEFDRLFRIGLSNSVEAVVHSGGSDDVIFEQLRILTQECSFLWRQHSNSMRLSIVEDLHDVRFAEDVKMFIEKYGEELFHARMLTLGNARAILHHGVEALFRELDETVRPIQQVRILDDIEDELLDVEVAAELIEFVLECVVDNFDRFLEYNTTTTYSDYGSRLYCLLDFLRVESLYDRFEWTWIPWQVTQDTLEQSGRSELAVQITEYVRDQTCDRAQDLVDELTQLEKKYGVQLPALHDRVHERVLGAMTQNRLASLVYRSCPEADGQTKEGAAASFNALRQELREFMQQRNGSGIEPPDWMQRLAAEVERAREVRLAGLTESLSEGEFTQLTGEEIDNQLEQIQDDNGDLRRPI